MCIKCLMKGIMEGVETAMGIQEVTVGTVSEGLRLEFEAKAKKRAAFNLEIDQMVLDARRALLNGEITEEQADEKQKEIDALEEKHQAEYDLLHTQLWDKVHAELGIPKNDKDYTVDLQTGVVTTKERVRPAQAVH